MELFTKKTKMKLKKKREEGGEGAKSNEYLLLSLLLSLVQH